MSTFDPLLYDNYEADTDLTPDEINAMEDRRLDRLSELGIDEKDVLAHARDNLNIWNSYFNENMTRGKDDQNFLLRDQWNSVERSEFQRMFKVCMTFNKLYDATKKVAGEQRKNKPDLIVRSLTGKATEDQIELRADLVRTISYQSQNDLVYQTAFKSALYSGFGAFQIALDYESPKSFNQVVRYKIVPDATRCSFDPTALKPHKGDGNYCARNYVFRKDEFAATYPYIKNPVSYTDPRTLLDFQWETRDTIVVCDYFKKEWFSTKTYRLSNGMDVFKEEWEDMQGKFKKMKELAKESMVVGGIIMREIPHIVRERATQDYRIMHYRMTKDCIIECSEWPSKQLPIIFVDGDSCFIEGRQYTRSFIHEAKDAQRFVNFVGSEIATEIKNRRREQWLGTPDNIIGQEQMWRNPEQQIGILMAKPDPKTGMMPTKQPPWDLSPSLMANFQRATQDINEILGFSESQDLQGKDISGKARRERKLEGSMSAYVFFDNLNQAIEQGGRVVLDLLPVIYGEHERHVVVSKKDGSTRSMVLNQNQGDDRMLNALQPGEYDIEIDSGPSFAVQKEIALEFLQQTVQTDPQVFNLIADLWAKNLDVQCMPQIVERLQTLVPPQIIAKEKGEPPPPPPPPSPQEQMMQQEMEYKKTDLQHKQQKVQSEAQLDAQDQQLRAQEMATRHQKDQIDQIELMLKAKQQQDDLQNKGLDRVAMLHKAHLDHAAKMTSISADIHKHHTGMEADMHKYAATLGADLHKHHNPVEKKEEKKEPKKKATKEK